MERFAVKSLNFLRLDKAARALKYRWLDPYTPLSLRPHLKEAIRFYSQFVSPGDLCFDIGANVGNRTEVFLKLGARVICVEPQKPTVAFLYHRFGRNRKVTIIKKGVAEQEGHLRLAVCEQEPGISTLSEDWRTRSRFSALHQWTRTEEIETTTLDSLIQQYGLPRFCKIDVEGFEESVLKGLSQPIPYLSFEFARELADSARKCTDRLEALGPVLFNFSIGESMRLAFEEWMPAADLHKELNSLEGKLLWGDIYARCM